MNAPANIDRTLVASADDTLARLSATVNVGWVNHRGCDREAEVEVDYTFDGDTARVTGFRALTDDPFADSYRFEELVTEAVDDLADEGYAEWLACQWEERATASEAAIPAMGLGL